MYGIEDYLSSRKVKVTYVHNVALSYLDDACGCVAGQIIISVTINIIHLQVHTDPRAEFSQFGLKFLSEKSILGTMI